MFRTIDETLLVSPQISVAEIEAAKALGVMLVINNRPEGESDDQTPGAEIEAAARGAGLAYVAIPVTHSGFSEAQVKAMSAALDGAEGKTLAYCRSGTRSTLLWALSQAAAGADADSLSAKAAQAGYDLTSIAPLMDMLRARA